MKFIHLSDLHLGKRVNDFSMTDDQRHILGQITEIINNEKPDAVLIAGDVYDKPAPPAEAPAAPPAPAEPERLTAIRPTLSEPDHDDSVFTGSLGAVSTEGYDPCHEEQLSGMEPVCLPGREEASAAEVPGIALGWTANDVVRGIVMSEILNRKR